MATKENLLTAADALRKWQKQCDPEGIEVQVSRQALDEVLDALEAMQKEIATLEELHRVTSRHSFNKQVELQKRIAELEAIVKERGV